MRITPRGFTRNLHTTAKLYVDREPVFSAVKPAYIVRHLPGVPPAMQRRRAGWLVWTPTPPPFNSRLMMAYEVAW